MLYGTRAATHALARPMISARVVGGVFTPVTAWAGVPPGPCSGALPPCGVSGSSSAGAAGRSGEYGERCAVCGAAAAAAGAAPSAAPVAAAAVARTARTRPAGGTGRPQDTAGRFSRPGPQAGQSQSLPGSTSSKAGASMRYPSHS